MSWGNSSAALPALGSAGSEPPVSLVVAGPPAQAQALYAAFLADARFRVQATATSPDDLRAKLAASPEVVVVNASMFNGPDDFAAVLAAYPGLAFPLLPPGIPAGDVEAVRRLKCVQAVSRDDANLPLLAGQIYEAVLARRQAQGPGVNNSIFAQLRAPGVTMIGWRAIAVWSSQGGVGKSTLSLALAIESAARRLPTLLIGLGAPDTIPITAGLRPEPNLLNWVATPTAEGLRAAVQRYDALDILAGFPDPLALTGYSENATDGPASLYNLVHTAADAGYAVVILDVSSQVLEAAALAAANTLVLVARPDLPGILHAVEATRLVHEVMAGRHRIPPQAIHLVVNMVRDTTLRPDEVAKAGANLRPDFPSLAAYVADDPQVELAVNQSRPPYFSSEALRRGAKALGDLLLAAPPASVAEAGRPGRVVKLGPVRIRM